MTTPAVTFYTRVGCHLCDDAREPVRSVAATCGATFVEVDVDGDEQVRERFGDMVPVVEVAGRVVGYWRIDPARVRAALGC